MTVLSFLVKHATQKRIKSILEKQFQSEIGNKESELLSISEVCFIVIFVIYFFYLTDKTYF